MWRAILILVGLAAIYQNFDFTGTSPTGLPEFPSINIDTRTVQKNSNNGLYETMTPSVPVHDLTRDGRIGVRKRGFHGGAPIFILKPERVKKYLLSMANPKLGAGLLDDEPDYVFNPDFLKSLVSEIRTGFSGERTFLCEKFLKRRNPYVCSTNRDCYDLTLITRFTTRDGGTSYLVGVDATIEVSDPKTLKASVAKVTFNNASVKHSDVFVYPKLAEPVVVGDNRLLLIRLGNALDLKLSDHTTPAIGGINIVYSTYPETDPVTGAATEQCDASKWNPDNMHPISHAPYDIINRMPSRYKFARYKFRDSFGKLIPNGGDIGGSYQWMDKGAANLMLTTFGTDGFYNIRATSRDPLQLVKPYLEPTQASYIIPAPNPEAIEPYEETGSPTAGVAMMGFWTYGKVVLFDGQLNNGDFTFRISDRVAPEPAAEVQRWLRLYTGGPAGQDFEPAGGVRELGDAVDVAHYSPHLATNSSFLGSLENRFNYVDEMFPVTPRDIVWHFGTTRHTEELVFDDYISSYVFINSDMTGALGQRTQSSMNHYDGILRGVRTVQDSEAVRQTIADQPSSGQLAFQNAATALSTFMKVPYYGVPAGNVRLEPLAKGGIYGKGVWFDGAAAIRYPIPAQSGSFLDLAAETSWYVSVFLDPREVDSTIKERVLFSLKDGDQVILAKNSSATVPVGIAYSTVVLRNSVGTKVSEIVLPLDLRPRNGEWSHFAIQFGYGSPPFLLINGFRYAAFSVASGVPISALNQFFNIRSASEVILGSVRSDLSVAANSNVRGWLDEFKVIVRGQTAEEKCNHARGTLINVDGASSAMLASANRYPPEAHDNLRTVGNLSGSRFLCYVVYGGADAGMLHSERAMAHAKNIPAGAIRVREDFLMRNKNLFYGKPRPDFSNNKFCLSCHISSSFAPSFRELNQQALEFRVGVHMEDDPRRQPMQPDARFRGVVPAHYFGPNIPNTTVLCPTSGCYVDQWIHGK